MSFFRKNQKELEQKSNSESQNNQPTAIQNSHETIHSLQNTVTNRKVFPQCRFSEKSKKS